MTTGAGVTMSTRRASLVVPKYTDAVAARPTLVSSPKHDLICYLHNSISSGRETAFAALLCSAFLLSPLLVLPFFGAFLNVTSLANQVPR